MNSATLRYVALRGEPVIYGNGRYRITCLDGEMAWISKPGGIGKYVPAESLSRPQVSERMPRPGRFDFFRAY